MAVITQTFSSNESKDFGQVVNPIISISGGTWGGGTLTVYFDGVEVDDGRTADFQDIYDSNGNVVTMTMTLAGATTPTLAVNALVYGAWL